MYSNNNSQKEILNRMLQTTSADVDKSEGSLTYDALSPASNEFEQIYVKLDEVSNKFDISKLIGDELATRVYQKTGITKKPATYAHTVITLTGTGNISIGDIAQTSGGIQFKFTEDKTINGTGTANVTAVIAGSSGMVPANQITALPVGIPGITAITNGSPTQDGFDEESDESLLGRYYEAIQAPSTQGNISQFIKLVKDYPGVGDVKVYPTWNGNDTIKLIIIDANKQPPSSEFINKVQTYMDPLGDNWGQGYGVAPFGAFTTIEGAVGKSIDISFTAIKDTNYSDEQRQTNFENALNEYLKSLAFKEASVSYTRLGALIISTPGFLDYSNLKVNGGIANIQLSYTGILTEVPIKGVVTIA